MVTLSWRPRTQAKRSALSRVTTGILLRRWSRLTADSSPGSNLPHILRFERRLQRERAEVIDSVTKPFLQRHGGFPAKQAFGFRYIRAALLRVVFRQWTMHD